MDVVSVSEVNAGSHWPSWCWSARDSYRGDQTTPADVASGLAHEFLCSNHSSELHRHRLGGQLVERNSLRGQECALLLIRRAVLQWIVTLHESFVRLVGGIGAATARSRWSARYLRGYELLPTVSRCE